MGKITSSSASSSKKVMMGARIDEKLFRMLKSNAGRKGKSVQEVLEQLVRSYLKREGDLE